MAEVQAEKPYGEEIEKGDEDVLKGQNEHRIDIVFSVKQSSQLLRAKPGVGRADCELEKVEDDEAKNDQAGENHGAGRNGGSYVIFIDVALPFGCAIFDRQLDRRCDVKTQTGEEKNPDQQQRDRHAVEELCICIDPLWAEKYLQISDHMADHVANQDEPSECDEPLLTDR